MLSTYLRPAWRNITKQKVYSFINIFGLAMALSAVWLIVLFVADELSYDRYHANSTRIYRLVTHGEGGDQKFDITGTSGLAAAALENDFSEVEKAVRINAEGGGVLQYENTVLKDDAIFFTDPEFFSVFSYRFIHGDKNALQEPNSIVLTSSLAKKLFGDASLAVNKSLSIDKFPAMVRGVIEDVPSNSHFSFNALRRLPENFEADWGNLSMYTYVLLKKSANINSLRAKLPRLVSKYMDPVSDGQLKFSLQLQPLTSIHLHSHLSYELGANRDVRYIYILAIVGLLILVIAFINYTNITTARASFRLREIAVRKIVGSARKHLIALFLSESLLTVLIATFISAAVVNLILPAFNQLTEKQLSLDNFGIIRSFVCILLFCLLSGVIGGIYPAWFLSRFKTIPALKNKVGDVKTQSLFRKSLVVFQFVVTVVMIIASLVIYLQLNFMLNTDLGFNKKALLTFHLDSRELRQRYDVLRSDLLKSTLIKDVASASNPIGNNNVGMMEYFVEKNGTLDQTSNFGNGLVIDPDFIPTMQIKMLEGRNFSRKIAADSNNVVVNEAFIKRHGWTSAKGKRLTRGKNDKGEINYANIIGVVKDFHIYSLQHKVEPIIMQLPTKREEQDNVYVRIAEEKGAESIAHLEKTFRSFDASSPFEYHFLDDNFAGQYKSEKRQGQVLLAFTVLTICIACLGLFGLITYTVDQRVREIGIRKVLGASVTQLIVLLTGGLIRVVLFALLIALPVAWLLMNMWLDNFAYRIHLTWWIFIVAGITACALAVATLSSQAIRAATMNPVKSLKTE